MDRNPSLTSLEIHHINNLALKTTKNDQLNDKYIWMHTFLLNNYVFQTNDSSSISSSQEFIFNYAYQKRRKNYNVSDKNIKEYTRKSQQEIMLYIFLKNVVIVSYHLQDLSSIQNSLQMGICANKADERSKLKSTAPDQQSPSTVNELGAIPPKKRIFQFAKLKNFQYAVIQDKIDEENERVKVIRQPKGNKEYVLKYYLGKEDHLKNTQKKIQEYFTLRFAYLAPIHQKQYENDQILVRISYYQNTLDELAIEKYQKCNKLIIVYRIARAIQYLQRKSLIHNKIQLSNIFVGQRSIHLGLPSWNSTKKNLPVARLLHINAFTSIFTTFFIENETKDEAIVNLIKQMKNCSNNQINMDYIVKSIFQLNFLDEPKNIEEKKKTIIEYQEGAKYQGQVDENKQKEGYGIMTELQSTYWGSWVNNRRSNRGNYKGKEYCYVGQWKSDYRQGLGLQINLLKKQYYQGNYFNGKKNGYGIWQGPKGQIYMGEWKQNKKQGFGQYYDGKNEFYYEGRWKEDMKCGRGRQVHSNGIYYDGIFKDNIKEGQGHYIHPNKFEYKGQFRNNSITGFGLFKDKEGNEYTGDLINGQYQGRGRYQSKDKSYFYDGQWKNGERHGEGQQRTKDSTYIGNFVRNIRQGKGVLKQLNQKYIGEFKKGKATGKGQYFYQNMDVYKGGFLDKIKVGKGTYISSVDGSIYEGFWHNDKKNGKGKHMLKTGQYYDGEWVDSKRQGFGKQFTNNKNWYEGFWKNDKKQGKGVQVQAGNKFQGEFKNGLKHCQFGTLTFANGDRYQGTFVQNRQQVKGKYVWKNGDEYVGEFVANNRQGQGKMLYIQNQVTYQGTWKNDKREGHGIEKYKDGQFIGKFVQDKKHGLGVRTYIDGEGTCKLAGPWANDMRHGEFDFYFPDQTSQKRQYFNDREINLGATAMPV